MSIRDLAAFLKWADKNGIQWDKDAIEVREGKHGLGVFAKKDLDAGQEGIQTLQFLEMQERGGSALGLSRAL